MLIFFSYKREDEKLRDMIVNTLERILPANIKFWTDVKKLRWGSDFPREIEIAIRQQADYFICLVSDKVANSSWVNRELDAALEREKNEKRKFVLPLVVKGTEPNAIWEKLHLDSLNYATVFPGTPEEMEKQAEAIAKKLFDLISEQLDAALHPDSDIARENEHRNRLESIAVTVRKTVFPHRDNNPLTYDELYAKVSLEYDRLTRDDFDAYFEELCDDNLLSGFCYDGEVIFLDTEHASWINEFRVEDKKKIAKKAYEYIGGRRQDRFIYIDSGSTAMALINYICARYANPTDPTRCGKLTVMTPSPEQLAILTDVSIAHEHARNRLEIMVPYGIINPSTETIRQVDEENRSFMTEVCGETGRKFDVAFIGVNGITLKGGILTYSSDEEDFWKIDAIKNAKKTVIICDSCKFGIESENLDSKVIDWDDDFVMITDRNDANPELAKILEKYGEKIVLV